MTINLDFLIIGAAKSGTTWLTKNLSKHPDIYIPKEKELSYFNAKQPRYEWLENSNLSRSTEWYSGFFNSASPHQILGEGSVAYLWDDQAPKNIYNYNPDIKIIAILRNPVERAYSHYRYLHQKGSVSNSDIFEVIFEESNILEFGLYYTQLKRYYDLFPQENIKILLFDDLISDNIRLLEEVETFLGVKKFIPEDIGSKVNPSGSSRFWLLNRAVMRTKFIIRRLGIDYNKWAYYSNKIGLGSPLNKIVEFNTKSKGDKQEMPPDLKNQLAAYYAGEISQVEKLTNMDLKMWKS